MSGSPPKPKFPFTKKPVGRPTTKTNTNKPSQTPRVKPLPKIEPPKPPKPPGKMTAAQKPRPPKPGAGIRTPKPPVKARMPKA